MSKHETTAAVMNNSSEAAQQTEMLQLVEKLIPYDTSFGMDYENLMVLFSSQIEELDGELFKGNIEEAKHKLSIMSSLFWTIKEKLPKSVFRNVEELSDNVKLTFKNL